MLDRDLVLFGLFFSFGTSESEVVYYVLVDRRRLLLLLVADLVCDLGDTWGYLLLYRRLLSLDSRNTDLLLDLALRYASLFVCLSGDKGLGLKSAGFLHFDQLRLEELVLVHLFIG